MADTVALAQTLWDLGREDPSILTTLKTERKTLVLAVAAGTNTGDLVSGSKNGASYTMRPGYNQQDRIVALGLAIWGLENSIRPSRTQPVYFQS